MAEEKPELTIPGTAPATISAISVAKIGDIEGAASIKVTQLDKYIRSFEAFRAHPESQELKETYLSLYSSLCSEVSGTLGDHLAEQMLTTAFDVTTLDEIDKKFPNFSKSAVCHFLQTFFVEIVKNLMDEGVLASYEGRDPKEINLILTIEPRDKFYILTIVDDGRGFPADLLTSLSSLQGQKQYIETAGSTKTQVASAEQSTRPKLFGGAGFGVRGFMAFAIYFGRYLGTVPDKEKGTKANIDHEFNPLRQSEINFSNHMPNGSQIVYICSNEPLTSLKLDSPIKRSKLEPAVLKDQLPTSNSILERRKSRASRASTSSLPSRATTPAAPTPAPPPLHGFRFFEKIKAEENKSTSPPKSPPPSPKEERLNAPIIRK